MDARRSDVAIIGMACAFPGAANLKAYWENILAGVDAITDAPTGSATARVFDPDTTGNDRLYTQKGGYLGDLLRFDPLAFGVMPRSVDGGEPEHFLALKLAHDALADAGYLERPFNRKACGVILGRGTYVNRGVISCFQHTIVVDEVVSVLKRLHPEHSDESIAAIRRSLKEALPPFNPETAPGLAHSVMVGRIANRLDLMGPAYTVDAACASSLIALDCAMRDLRSGACDMVLAGGVQISSTYPVALLFTQLGALARSGRIRPFHPEADGTLLGEGAGLVVLKRREDAERDGDRIYAVVKGVGIASDGKAMGILAPRVEGEELAMRRAYETTGVEPASIGLIEAHGTGTPVGDATEIEALRRVFGDGDGTPRVPIGSVKSMIGHCIPAAAVAGLIKVALAVHHRIAPPTLHADTSHPKLAGSRFYPNPAARPWIHAGPEPRRAAVSAFGFGGINAHAILEEPGPAPRAALRGRPVAAAEAPYAAIAPGASDPATNLHGRRDTELYLVRAADRAGLVRRIAAIRAFLAANPAAEPRDVAYALNCSADGEASDPACLAAVADSLAELDRKLAHAEKRLADPACRRIKEKSGIYWFEERLREQGGLAFLFPGEGAQYPGMLGDLCLHFPEARAWFDLMDGAFRDHRRGFVPSQVVFPAPGTGGHGAAPKLWEMESAIESVFAADQAMHAVLAGLGLRPDAACGHSTGEYAALLAAGAVEVEDAARLVEHVLDGNRATTAAQQKGIVPRGALLAVGPADQERLRALAASTQSGEIFLAMDNCPHQVVLCGTEEAIARMQEELRARGAICQRLPFDRAYHTPLFEPVCEELRDYYAGGRFRAPRLPLYSCATAARVPADGEEVRRLALLQWARPVRFRETVEAMYADGIRLFVEVGPRGNLTQFVEDTLRGRPHLAVAANVTHRSGMTQLHHLLGLLAAHGQPLDLAPLYERRGAVRPPEAALRDGTRVAAAPDRSQPLLLDLPRLRLDDAVVAAQRTAIAPRPVSVPAARPAAVPVAAAAVPMISRSAAALASAAVAADPRAAVMQDYLRTMEAFLKTQEEVLGAVLARRGGAAQVAVAASLAAGVMTDAPVAIGAPAGALAGAPAAVPATLPFIGEPARREGDTTVFSRTLSIDEEIFLTDHTLGGTISEEATLRALPVFPLAMTLEMMAEAAARTVAGRVAVGMERVRVHRWLEFAAPRVSVEIAVTPRPDGTAAETRVTRLPEQADGAPLLVAQGTVLLGAALPAAPAAPAFDAGAPRPFRWRPEELYAEGKTHGMFHGPRLQGVASIDRCGDGGAEATLRVLPRRGLLRSNGDPAFLFDPLLIDAVSQVVGYWTANLLDRGFVVFPGGFERLETFAAPRGAAATAANPATGATVDTARVTGRARCRIQDDGRVLADLEVADASGRLLLKISGWEVKRIDLPEKFYAFRLDPRGVILSEPFPAPAPARDRLACCRLELPDQLMEADGRIWREGLAHVVLGRTEREAWRSLGGPEKRRTEWLLGRAAAKDAVRLLLGEKGGPDVFPADIEIGTDASGKPVVTRLPGSASGLAPVVSIAHSRGLAVAIAGDGGPDAGLGVDVERMARLDAAFEETAFTAEERHLLQALDGAGREEWTLRLWCAKEAAAKALGTGLPGGPRDALVREVDPRGGTVDVAVAGEILKAHPELAGRRLSVYTARADDLVLALTSRGAEHGN